MNKAYELKTQLKPVSFEEVVKLYLKWSKDNKKVWETDEYRAKPLVRAFKSKLMSDINPFLIEKFKVARAKQVTKATVNKELIFGCQLFKKAIEWGRYSGENPFLKADKFKVKKGKINNRKVLAVPMPF